MDAPASRFGQNGSGCIPADRAWAALEMVQQRASRAPDFILPSKVRSPELPPGSIRSAQHRDKTMKAQKAT
jgi:hypothetical protein